MIVFEEEIKRYSPMMEVKDVENMVKNRDLTDMVDILKEMTADIRVSEGGYR